MTEIVQFGNQWAAKADGEILATGGWQGCYDSLSEDQKAVVDEQKKALDAKLRTSGELEAVICRTGRNPYETVVFAEYGLDANS